MLFVFNTISFSTMDELREQRWATGKDAVDAVKDLAMKDGKRAVVQKRGGTYRLVVCDSLDTGCSWFVSVARLRSKNGPGDWHVTEADLDHQNCSSVARPSRRQLEENEVVRAALASDPTSSARALTVQLQHQAGISVSQHIMYRAKERVLSHMYSEDETTIQLLPAFLVEFQRLNPGVFTELHRDQKGRFRRAIIVLNPIWYLSGQGIYGVDAAHMKHRKYNGVQILLVSRDGNFNNKIAAVALAPIEDTDNYAWFFTRILEHGFPLTTCPVFSDRHHGLVSAANTYGVFNMFCVRHLIGNMRSDKTVRLAVSQEKFVWQANAATTEVDFLKAIEGLNNVNKAAAEYLRAIPVVKWTLHPHYKTTPMYGWRTTNFVESEQAKSLRLKPRMMLPFEYFKSYATILMGECYVRKKIGETWITTGRMVTPRAEAKFQEEMRASGDNGAVFSTDDVAFVSNVQVPLKHRRVDTKQPDCSCSTWKQQNIPCRHLLAALIAQERQKRAIELMGACYKVSAYVEGTGSLEIPEDSALARDSTLLLAPIVRQAGRPPKRRFRARGEVGGKARKPYKCGRCGVIGHNKATCRAILT